ncbi:tenascin-like [Scaptodrosophila lebanonensis]|uniref:Tenascin-like n=1 Tax=Drosophila lebanonensis TaxID=7225 RepID=A0A6J2TNQ0_DROLE|nr:tenascin-like [Scaptodrosophila lebanonensis]
MYDRHKTALKMLAIRVLFLSCLATSHQLYGDIYSEIESLSLIRQKQTHLCYREVPAVFFQVAKNEPIRGNGSSIFYQRIEVCCVGYRRVAEQCVPDCSHSSPDNCRNGFCRAPNSCECFEEFVRNEHGSCIHTCPIACQHGRCYMNGTCSCHSGYELDQETRLFCRPHCPLGCGTHQECVAPGKCDCLSGYQRTEFGCQPVCTPDCGYGKCVGPNQCDCFPGYMKRKHRNVCETECYLNCENGFCESRMKCHCHEGYSYDVNTDSCLPQCSDNCNGNGVCIAPGVCRCYEGYELLGNSCEPVCWGGCGYYGRCLAPNVCGCSPDRQHCLFGSCTAQGHCQCPPGLTYFVDRCLSPEHLQHGAMARSEILNYNQQFIHEFRMLIGRLFI